MRSTHWLIFGAGLVLAATLFAQDEAAESEPVIVESVAAPDEAAAAEDAGAAEVRAQDKDEDRFVPSSEVPPTEEVIFPIDI